MATTIYVRKLYADQGKFGMEYKILATDGLYYTSKKPFEALVEEGASLLVETEPTKNPKYLKLKSYKLLNYPKGTDANPSSGQTKPPKPEAKPIGKAEPVKASLSIEPLTPALQVIWIKNALYALKCAGLDPDIENAMLVQLVKQYGEDRMNKVIDAQQNKRYGR